MSRGLVADSSSNLRDLQITYSRRPFERLTQTC